MFAKMNLFGETPYIKVTSGHKTTIRLIMTLQTVKYQMVVRHSERRLFLSQNMEFPFIIKHSKLKECQYKDRPAYLQFRLHRRKSGVYFSCHVAHISAYVDKFFIPLMFSLNRKVIQYLSIDEDVSFCQTNVTFQAFLDFITGQAYDGKALDQHQATSFSLCRPYDVNRFILVKQDSFARDVAHVLQGVRV